MKYKVWAKFFVVLGFIASLSFPIWGTVSQVIVIRANCQESIWETIGVTASGAVIILLIVFFTLWKYFSAIVKEKMKPQRTLFSFFAVGYILLLVLEQMFTTLEIIFLSGLIGATIAVICYYISDRLKERGKTYGGEV